MPLLSYPQKWTWEGMVKSQTRASLKAYRCLCYHRLNMELEIIYFRLSEPQISFNVQPTVTL